MKKIFAILILAVLISSCASKRTALDRPTVTTPKISKKSGGFWAELAEGMRFKKITPRMEVQIEEISAQGCVPEYELLDRETAYMYSLIPGGGQIYAGEPKKAFIYALSSILIVPYFLSFEDAQSSVDYLNIQHSIDFCKKKLRLSEQMEKRAKNRQFMNQIMQR